MKRKTIEQLEKELAQSREREHQYYVKWSLLEKKEDENNQNKFHKLNNDALHLESQVRNLMEIIRWKINPLTAETPFLPTKDQRENNGNKFYRD